MGYVIIKNNRNKKAIVDNETGKQVSKWWTRIYINSQNPNYYIVKDSNNYYTIFHINNPHEPVSQ